MDEPLLGSHKKYNLSINPALFYIPEDAAAEARHNSPLVCKTPSSLKDILIFGSPESSPRSPPILVNGAPPSHGRNNEVLEQLLNKCGNKLSRSYNSFGNRDFDRLHNREDKARWHDDSFVHYGNNREPVITHNDYRLGAAEYKLFSSSGKDLENSEQREDNCRPEQHDVVNVQCSALPRCKKLFHRSMTAPAISVMDIRGGSTLPNLHSTTSSVVKQAFVGLMIYLVVGVLIYVWWKEDFSGHHTSGFIDALYFCIVTMCTIGYGDITPATPAAKLFACCFVLVGFGFIDILLTGVVSYILDKQETVLLGVAAGQHHGIAEHYLVDVKKGRMRIRMKVALAFSAVISSVGIGTIAMHSLESLTWVDCLYLSCMSVTTVGYGDRAFKTPLGRIFASIWLLVSTLAVARAFLYLAEARMDKRHRLMARLVLEKDMTVGDLVAADLDNDNCVSKSDFVVYKLKQMGKLEEKDILEVCRQFSRLDTDNSGKIHLSYLIDHHEAPLMRK
eukprot:c24449_g1_i1 orf=620-2134(+)